jgi:hypothetical protein
MKNRRFFDNYPTDRSGLAQTLAWHSEGSSRLKQLGTRNRVKQRLMGKGRGIDGSEFGQFRAVLGRGVVTYFVQGPTIDSYG